MDLGSQQTPDNQGINQVGSAGNRFRAHASSKSPYGQGSTGLRPVWIPAEAKAEVTVLEPGEEAFGGHR